jgi:RNA recognition motif-containing protein
MFEKYGKVELIALPKSKETDQPRGFAFVDLSSNEELEAAVTSLDGTLFRDRTLRVMKSIPQEDREKAEKPKRKVPDPRTEDGSKKIYVGNIKFDTTKDELMELFTEYGIVSEVFIPVNTQTGQGRGFAFVSMSEEDSEKAIEATNGITFQGRRLVVNRPLAPGEKTPGRRTDRRTKLYIGNLSFYTVGETLKEIFEEFGQVYDCYLPEDPTTGGTRGFGFVTMAREDALNAISELDGCEVDGRVIRVNEAKPKGRSNNEETTFENDDNSASGSWNNES